MVSYKALNTVPKSGAPYVGECFWKNYVLQLCTSEESACRNAFHCIFFLRFAVAIFHTVGNRNAFIGFAVGFNNRTVSVYGVLQTACNECLRKYTWGNQGKTDCRNKEHFLFHACRMLVQR